VALADRSPQTPRPAHSRMRTSLIFPQATDIADQFDLHRSLRNKTVVGMLLAISIPLFYMVGQPGKIAEKQVDRNSTGPFAKNNPAEKLDQVQGGMPGGRQEQRNQWEGR
jgi:hypothetical protein